AWSAMRPTTWSTAGPIWRDRRCGPASSGCRPRWRRTSAGAAARAELAAGVLLDVPEHRRRGGEQAVQPVLAVGDRLEAHAQVHMRADLQRALLHLRGDRLLLRRIGLAGELVAQGFQLGVAGPAEHRLVAGRIEEAE